MINLIPIVAVKLNLGLIRPYPDLLAMQRGEDWESNKMLIIFNECELCSSADVAVADHSSITLLAREMFALRINDRATDDVSSHNILLLRNISGVISHINK